MTEFLIHLFWAVLIVASPFLALLFIYIATKAITFGYLMGKKRFVEYEIKEKEKELHNGKS